MGVKWALRHQCLSKEHRLTEWSISIAKGKHRYIHEDPYAEGEQSGKHTKPDTISTKANANAYACASFAFVAAPLTSTSTSQPIT